MPSRKRSSGPSNSPSRPTPAAGALWAALTPAQQAALVTLRDVIRGVDPAIQEGVKWNAPSFHTVEHFATFQLRHKPGVQVVLHLGAKPRPGAAAQARIADPAGLLEWRGPDRATVTFADASDVAAKRPAFEAVVQQWLTLVA